jgi:hypothetical protein
MIGFGENESFAKLSKKQNIAWRQKTWTFSAALVLSSLLERP